MAQAGKPPVSPQLVEKIARAIAAIDYGKVIIEIKNGKPVFFEVQTRELLSDDATPHN